MKNPFDGRQQIRHADAIGRPRRLQLDARHTSLTSCCEGHDKMGARCDRAAMIGKSAGKLFGDELVRRTDRMRHERAAPSELGWETDRSVY